MATLKTKIEEWLKNGNKKCYIRFGSYIIKLNTRNKGYYFKDWCQEVKCTSITELELLCPGITEMEVVCQFDHFGIPEFGVRYDSSKFEKNKWRWLLNARTKELEERIQESSGIKRDILTLGREIVSFSDASNKEKALAIKNLFGCYDESDYKALQTMMYMLKHPEVKKAKITYAYNASEFWVGLGHTKYYLKKANDYCIKM